MRRPVSFPLRRCRSFPSDVSRQPPPGPVMARRQRRLPSPIPSHAAPCCTMVRRAADGEPPERQRAPAHSARRAARDRQLGRLADPRLPVLLAPRLVMTRSLVGRQLDRPLHGRAETSGVHFGLAAGHPLTPSPARSAGAETRRSSTTRPYPRRYVHRRRARPRDQLPRVPGSCRGAPRASGGEQACACGHDTAICQPGALLLRDAPA